jgi:hypothetical protein
MDAGAGGEAAGVAPAALALAAPAPPTYKRNTAGALSRIPVLNERNKPDFFKTYASLIRRHNGMDYCDHCAKVLFSRRTARCSSSCRKRLQMGSMFRRLSRLLRRKRRR